MMPSRSRGCRRRPLWRKLQPPRKVVVEKGLYVIKSSPVRTSFQNVRQRNHKYTNIIKVSYMQRKFATCDYSTCYHINKIAYTFYILIQTSIRVDNFLLTSSQLLNFVHQAWTAQHLLSIFQNLFILGSSRPAKRNWAEL